jgi:hypothetical protein
MTIIEGRCPYTEGPHFTHDWPLQGQLIRCNGEPSNEWLEMNDASSFRKARRDPPFGTEESRAAYKSKREELDTEHPHYREELCFIDGCFDVASKHGVAFYTGGGRKKHEGHLCRYHYGIVLQTPSSLLTGEMTDEGKLKLVRLPSVHQCDGCSDCDSHAIPRKQREGDQPLPVKNEQPIIQELVMEDLKKRLELGIQRYGTGLQPFNGRDALQDAYEEAMDLTVYLRQLIYERDSKADGCVVDSAPLYDGGEGLFCATCSDIMDEYVLWEGHNKREAELIQTVKSRLRDYGEER